MQFSSLFLTIKKYAHSKKSTAQQGFTLVELLVVIFIIGILASLLVTNFVGVRDRAGDAKRKSDLDAIRQSLQLYYNDYQRYPNSSNGVIAGCGSTANQPCTVGGGFIAGSDDTVYMKQLPEEASYYSDGNDQFILLTILDNASDGDIERTQSKCNPASKTYVPDSVVLDTAYVLCEN